MNNDLFFEFEGKIINESFFGSGYFFEFTQILNQGSQRKIKKILEWGSGLTTLLMAKFGCQINADLFLSIDDNKNYQNAIFFNKVKPHFLHFVAQDLVGTKLSQQDVGLNYSHFPLSISDTFDFIFIDGRRRVECAFVASLLCHQETIVVLHDYKRERYQSILKLFNIVKDGRQFRTMQIKESIYHSYLESK